MTTPDLTPNAETIERARLARSQALVEITMELAVRLSMPVFYDDLSEQWVVHDGRRLTWQQAMRILELADDA
jgi:hypothetical protein